jgi:integrase
VQQHLAAALEVAVDDRFIPMNPVRKLKLPRRESDQISPSSSDDLGALIGAASPWFRVAIVLGAGLGLRLGEAAGLTLDRIDFLRRRCAPIDSGSNRPAHAPASSHR